MRSPQRTQRYSKYLIEKSRRPTTKYELRKGGVCTMAREPEYRAVSVEITTELMKKLVQETRNEVPGMERRRAYNSDTTR